MLKVNLCLFSLCSILLLSPDFLDAQGNLHDLEIHLRPTVRFCNYLPFAVRLSTETDKYKSHPKVVEPGHQVKVVDADVTSSSLKAWVSLFVSV